MSSNFITYQPEKVKKQKVMQASVYTGDSYWTDLRRRKAQQELAEAAEGMPAITSFFSICDPSPVVIKHVLTHKQKIPKRQQSPSPDHYLLSDSALPGPGELDLLFMDEDAILSYELPELIDLYRAEIQEELDGWKELIEENEVDVLYGVSQTPGTFQLTLSLKIQQEYVDHLRQLEASSLGTYPIEDPPEINNWLEEEDEVLSPVDIRNVIREQLKVVKKFRTARAVVWKTCFLQLLIQRVTMDNPRFV